MISVIIFARRAMQKKIEEKTKPIVDFPDKKFIFAANEFLSTFPLNLFKIDVPSRKTSKR